MVTTPSETPLTLPFSSTVAMDVSLEVQLTLLLAPLGSTLAVSWMILRAMTSELPETVIAVAGVGSTAS